MCLNKERLSIADNLCYIKKHTCDVLDSPNIQNSLSFTKHNIKLEFRNIMAKRFTDTGKWDDPFFMDMSDQFKLVYLYILDRCDAVGVWKVNTKLLEFHLSQKINWGEFTKYMNNRLKIIDHGKWWVVKFCDFQYGDLNEDSLSKPIISYINLLKKHNLYKDYTKGIGTLKEKEKEQDKEKDKEKEDTKYSKRFEILWASGHRPTDSKVDCYDKYKKVIKTNKFEADFLLDKWVAYVKFTKVEDPELKYIKGFVPWLNKKGWDAEYKIQSTYRPEKKHSGQIEAERISKLPKKEQDEYHEKAEEEFKKLKNKFRESV